MFIRYFAWKIEKWDFLETSVNSKESASFKDGQIN